MKNKYRYIVAYEHNLGVTNAQIEVLKPITSISDINSIQKDIIEKQLGFRNPVIIFYKEIK